MPLSISPRFVATERPLQRGRNTTRCQSATESVSPADFGGERILLMEGLGDVRGEGDLEAAV
jgi:hypothetical protein